MKRQEEYIEEIKKEIERMDKAASYSYFVGDREEAEVLRNKIAGLERAISVINFIEYKKGF